jgi:hypothetical protein
LIQYIDDIYKKEKIIDKYINNFKNCLKKHDDINRSDISCIYISGKTNKHNEIKKLNNNVCRLEAKADIYIKFKDNSFIGLSVKQDKKATKSNYSVHKILGIAGEKMKCILKNFLQQNKDTKDINTLFYKDNIYWNLLRQEIDKQKIFISTFLCDKLYCANVNYHMYEFNGCEMIKLNDRNHLLNKTFEEYLPFYYNLKGEKRKVAKLFYKLTCGKKEYRVEIRWKGNINASPQFHIHDI